MNWDSGMNWDTFDGIQKIWCAFMSGSIVILLLVWSLVEHRTMLLGKLAAFWTRNLARIKVGAVVVASLVAFPFVVKVLVRGLVLFGYFGVSLRLWDDCIRDDFEAFHGGVLVALLFTLSVMLVAFVAFNLRKVILAPITWLISKAEAEERERLRAAQERTEAREAEIREQRAIDEERERLWRLERLDRERIEALEANARELRAPRMSMLIGLDPALNVARPVQVDSDGAVVLKQSAEPLIVPADARCPVCKTQVLDGCAIVFCGACRLVHHEECAAGPAGHKCAAYGCGAELPKAVPLDEKCPVISDLHVGQRVWNLSGIEFEIAGPHEVRLETIMFPVKHTDGTDAGWYNQRFLNPFTVGQRVRSRAIFRLGQFGVIERLLPTLPRWISVRFADGQEACFYPNELESVPPSGIGEDPDWNRQGSLA